MKQLFILTSLLMMSLFITKAQDSTNCNTWKGKYFKHTHHKGTIFVTPLSTSSIYEPSDMFAAEVDYGDRDWTEFTTIFVDRVLKKYLTIEEIRLLIKKEESRSLVKLYSSFNYFGDILYARIFFREEAKHILSEEKLYAIYQDFMKLKVDVKGFL